MDSHITPWVRTKTGFVRLRLPLPAPSNWEEIHFVIAADDLESSPVLHVWRWGDSARPLDIVVEESRDGVCWAAMELATTSVHA